MEKAVDDHHRLPISFLSRVHLVQKKWARGEGCERKEKMRIRRPGAHC
jgi:hypothetical protein